MTDKFFKKTGKIIFLLLVSHIFILYFFSTTPILYETISADNPEFWIISPRASKSAVKSAVINNYSNQSLIKTRVHYNYHTMQKRDNSVINNIYLELQTIKYTIWGGLIFVIISFIGLTLHSTEKYQKKSIILMYISFVIIIFSGFSFYKQWFFIKTVEVTSNVDLSTIWDSIFNIYYFQIILFTGFISVLGSVIYIGRISFRVINQSRDIRKKEALDKIVLGSSNVEKKPYLEDVKYEKPFFEPEKKEKIKEPFHQKTSFGSNNYNNNIEEIDFEKKIHSSNDLGLDEKKELDSKEDFFNENNKKEEQKKVDGDDSKNIENSTNEKTDIFSSENQIDQADSFKEVKIRCPKCKHVFKIKKKINGVTNMYCPQCGQKGVLR